MRFNLTHTHTTYWKQAGINFHIMLFSIFYLQLFCIISCIHTCLFILFSKLFIHSLQYTPTLNLSDKTLCLFVYRMCHNKPHVCCIATLIEIVQKSIDSSLQRKDLDLGNVFRNNVQLTHSSTVKNK